MVNSCEPPICYDIYMQTRIILHGGNSDRNTEKNDRFYQEIIGGIESEPIKILCVYFARPRHRWEESYYDDQYTFKRLAIESCREIYTKLADGDLEAFANDIAWSDVIFLSGGMRSNLKDTLLAMGLDRFRQLIAGKTLVGVSAGANILAKYYYSSVIDGIREGTGLLNIKLCTHYAGEIEQVDMLESYGRSLPIVTVAEEEFVIKEL